MNDKSIERICKYVLGKEFISDNGEITIPHTIYDNKELNGCIVLWEKDGKNIKFKFKGKLEYFLMKVYV